MFDKYGIEVNGLGEIIDSAVCLLGLSFLSLLLGVVIYVLVKSFEEGKERAAIRDEIERREALRKKKLENLKLENLEISLTDEDIDLLHLMTESNGTIKGTLGYVLREHLRSSIL